MYLAAIALQVIASLLDLANIFKCAPTFHCSFWSQLIRETFTLFALIIYRLLTCPNIILEFLSLPSSSTFLLTLHRLSQSCAVSTAFISPSLSHLQVMQNESSLSFSFQTTHLSFAVWSQFLAFIKFVSVNSSLLSLESYGFKMPFNSLLVYVLISIRICSFKADSLISTLIH